jgi:hypothetical protein
VPGRKTIEKLPRNNLTWQGDAIRIAINGISG